MAMAERAATCTWEGDLVHGAGAVTGATGALPNLPVTWAARTQSPDSKTSPEELVAAAHASCFSMALAATLAKAGSPPGELEVTAVVTLDERDGAPTVTTSKLTVSGHVSGIDQAGFEEAANDAGRNCPISRALAGVEISVQARLEA